MIVVIFMHKLLRLQDYILSLCLNCLNIKVFNSLRSRQNGRHFAGDIFKHIHSLKPSDACMRQKLNIIGSDNGLLPNRYQAIIWTCDGIFLIGPIGIT